MLRLRKNEFEPPTHQEHGENAYGKGHVCPPYNCVLFVFLSVWLLVGCQFLEPPPTLTPTRELTGPTIVASPVVRGEFPTESAVIIGQNNPTAAALPSGGNLPPVAMSSAVPGEVRQSIEVILPSGTHLPGDLYSAGDLRVPGVLMLAPDSSAWLDLPLRLQAAGLTVLTVNTPANLSASDFSVMMHSLSDVGTVDPANMAVVGAEAAADLTLIGCAQELLCDAAALISPTQGEALLPAMQAFNPRSLFLAAGSDDDISLDAVTLLEDYSQGEVLVQQGSGFARGAALVEQNPTIGDELVRWLRAQFVV
jgi:hypothetical protein